MRDLLTAVAGALIVLILVALFGPMLVNWNSQRGFLESKLTALMGQTVRVQGPIDLRLLPTPVLNLADIRWGEDRDHPVFSAETLTLEIATGPLLKGEIQILDASLEAGRLDLRYDQQGGLSLAGGLAPGSGHRAVAVERFVLKRSTVLIEDLTSGGGMILTGLDLELQAGALQGPWRVSGRGALDGRPIDLRLSTAAPDETAQVRLIASLSAQDGWAVQFDGQVQPDTHQLAGQLNWTERYLLQGEKGLENRSLSVSAQVRGEGRRFQLDGLEIDGGPDTGLKLGGSGQFHFAQTPRLALDLTARSLDLDFPVIGKQGGALLPEVGRAWTRLAHSVMQGRMSQSRIETTLALSVQSVTMGGETLRDATLSAVMGPQGGRLNSLSLGLPGRGQMEASGVLGRWDDLRFSGPVRVSVQDVPRFRQWMSGADARAALPAWSGVRQIQFDGEVTLAAEVQAARIRALHLDQSIVSGFVRLTAPDGNQRGRLEAQLGSDRLSVDDLPDLSPFMTSLSTLDTQIAVEARSITLGGETATGRLTAGLSGDAKALRIDRLDYDDGHDTVVRGGGVLSENGGRLDLHIEAKRLRLLTGLVSRLLPPDLAGAVVRRAVDWAPLSLDLTVDQPSRSAQGRRVSLKGLAAGTQLRIDGAVPIGAGLGDFAGRVLLAHPSFAVLLRQFGFAVPVAVAQDPVRFVPGQIDASIDGPQGRGTLRFDAGGLGVDLDMRQSATGLTGTMQVAGDNSVPLAQALGLAAPGLEDVWPLNVKGPVQWRDHSFGFGPLTGAIKDKPLTGELLLMPERNRIEGRLTLGTLALADLFGLASGPLAQPLSGSIWPSARFADVPAQAVDLDLALKLDHFQLGGDVALKGADLSLRREGETLAVTVREGQFGSGQLAGVLTLRRDGGRLGATLRLSGQDWALADLVGAQSGLTGQVQFELDVGAAGVSLAELVSRSTGAGTLSWRNGQISGLDPKAIGRVIETSRGMPDLARLRAEISRDVQLAPFRFEKAEAPLTLSDGVLRLSSLAIPQEQSHLQMSGQFDLRTLNSEARLSLTAKPPQGWKGPAPDLSVVLMSSGAGPVTREINVNSLYALLTTRAVEVEAERLIEEQKKSH